MIAPDLRTTVSPVSTAPIVPDEALSTKTRRPPVQLVPPEHELPSVEAQTVTRLLPPSFSASLLANARSPTNPLASEAIRLLTIIWVKDGAAKVASTPMTATTTINSIIVNPCTGLDIAGRFHTNTDTVMMES